MTRATRSVLKIDVLVASDRWKKSKKAAAKTNTASAKAIVRRAVTRAATAVRSTSSGELAIVLTDDSSIRLLNRDWRGVDAATNVLSFPTKNGNGNKNASGNKTANGKNTAEHLGDIVLAFETIAREARDEGKPFAHHLAHLAVHGFLHLVGYDHERDKDAQIMEDAERDILRQLAIPDPYGPNVGAAKPAKSTAGKSTAGKTAAGETAAGKATAGQSAAGRARAKEPAKLRTSPAAKHRGSRSRKSEIRREL
jgi:probable rRNA maturation factor